MNQQTVGFIGLGNMGLPMAHNLLKAGNALLVFNRTATRAESLLAQGATWVASPRELATQTSIVLSMVADDPALEAIAVGDDGLLPSPFPRFFSLPLPVRFHPLAFPLLSLV